MKNLPRYFSVLTVASLLTGGVAFAQSSASPSGSDRRTSDRRTSEPATTTPRGTTEGRNANSTAGVPPSTDPTANPHASDSTGKSQTQGTARDTRENRTSRSYSSEGTILPQTSGTGITTGADATATVHAIQTQPIESQKQLVSEIEQRVEESSRMIKRKASTGAETTVDASRDSLKQAEQQLKRSLRNARNATADTWESARAALAADYAAYATALSNAYAASGNNLNSSSALPTDPSASSTSDRDTSTTPRNP
jgi:hypothetical protein